MTRSWTSWPRRLLRRWRRIEAERSLSVELVSACNLHCAYCVRDEEMLYGTAVFLPPDRLAAILDGAARAWPRMVVTFTGGEPALHPRFAEIVETVAHRGLPYQLVTNGWHFDRIVEPLTSTKRALRNVAFSVDGATRAAHDRHRGDGSFDRAMRAVASARARELPFQMNVVLRRDTFAEMEALAVFAARLGARAVNFGALLPTSETVHREWSLSETQEQLARAEADDLSRVLRIPVRVSLGLHDETPGAHCLPLSGHSANVDYRGRLTLCGILSSFRAGTGTDDVIAERDASSVEAFHALRALARRTLASRDGALRACRNEGRAPGPLLGSPCLSCLDHFTKLAPPLRAALLAPPIANTRAS